MENEAKCRIRRIAILHARHTEHAELLVEGRVVLVPLGKVAAEAQVGDPLSWNGQMWRQQQE
ncbi:hypothetical protein FHS18_001856 [Paenibacillus phyllosphaerae]|uniref:Uncharacterized protein n=1 Tax=Paenibacillus phyllosphaerae TaxID=274593 RepID=A0A7W5AW42_9BACL|nr:hypothetical protein [Paenibacillus phyllosphaerae]MBB3109793.1 hypothetical protein [Paenibacillus phyllosphaerae]